MNNISIYEKIPVVAAIAREIQAGNIDFAKQLQFEAIEFLRERQTEHAWLIECFREDFEK